MHQAVEAPESLVGGGEAMTAGEYQLDTCDSEYNGVGDPMVSPSAPLSFP